VNFKAVSGKSNMIFTSGNYTQKCITVYMVLDDSSCWLHHTECSIWWKWGGTFSEHLLIDVLNTKLCTNFTKEILAWLREFCIPEQCASIACIRHLKLFIGEFQILLMRFSVRFITYRVSWYGCNYIQIVVSCVCIKRWNSEMKYEDGKDVQR
jgi:hypothetical protein